MNLNAKIYIAGHRGLVGSAIHRNLSLLFLGSSCIYPKHAGRMRRSRLARIFLERRQHEMTGVAWVVWMKTNRIEMR